MRLAAAHRWPAFENADATTQSTARPRSASSQTTSAFLPPSSMHVFASRRPAVSAISAPGRRGTGEADEVDTRVVDERHPGLGPEALEHVEHPRRQPRLEAEATEPPCGERRVLGRLQHRAVPAEDRRERLPRHVRERCVEGDEERGDPHRATDGEDRSMRHRRGRRPPVGTPPLAGDEEAHLDRGLRLAERELERLARLGRDELARLVAPLAEELGDGADDVPALHRGA